MIFIACSAEHDTPSSINNSNFTKNSSPDPAIVSAAQTVLENDCLVCHGTTSGINTRFLPDSSGNIDMDALVDDSRYVQIGVPLGSQLFTYFSSMPIGGALGTSSTEAQAVSDWITEMGIPTGSNVTFTQVWTNTLSPKCLDCHASDAVGGPAGSVAFDGYSDLVGTLIVPGNSAGSPLVDSIANRMPKETRGSTGKVTDPQHPYYVSDAELDDIRAWVDAGALDN